MNLDSTVQIIVRYDVQTLVAEIIEDWTDGEILELLEGDEEALTGFAEEALEWVLNTEAEKEEILVDGDEV